MNQRKSRRMQRRQLRRIKSLSKEDECPGCGLKAPWLGVFIHAIMPEEVRGHCEYADSLKPMNKMARFMTLAQMGIPLDERIIKDIEKKMFENPDEESLDFIHTIHSLYKEAGLLDNTDKPTSTPSDSYSRDEQNAWKQFDTGTENND